MSEKLRVDVAPKHKDDCIEAFEFEIGASKEVIVRECWRWKEEIWGNGVTIRVPADVWAKAAPWIAERI